MVRRCWPQMTIWRRADTLWRVTAALGLIIGVNLVVTEAMLLQTICLPHEGPVDLPPDQVIVLVRTTFFRSVGLAICWLAMNRWGVFGWLWCIPWLWSYLRWLLLVAGSVTQYAFLPAMFNLTVWWPFAIGVMPASLEPGSGYTRPWVLLPTVLVSSQVWVAWMAWMFRKPACARDQHTVRGPTASVWSKATWGWRVISLLGLAAVGWPAMSWMFSPHALDGADKLLICLGTAGLVGCCWTSLARSGAGASMWSLLWGMVTPMYVSSIVYEIRYSGSNPTLVLVEILPLILLAISQVWVSWKAGKIVERSRAHRTSITE